jgi:hypothetical protein
MLWTMLNAICFLISVIAAVEGAKQARVGFSGYALAILIGLILGGTCTRAMWTVGERVIAAVQPYAKPKQEMYFRALYLGGVMWILIVVFIADHVTLAMVRQ